MAKSAKIIIKYGRTKLPKRLSDILADADELDLKILITLMMAAGENGEVAEDFSVSETLGIEESTVAASLKFWRGAGVIGGARSASKGEKKTETSAPAAEQNVSAAEQSDKAVESNEATAAQPAEKESAEEKPVIQTAHRNGAVEKSVGLSVYATDELASLFEKRRITAEFIDEAQRVFGKTFNSYDTGIVVGLVDQLGFEEEAVLAILSYVAKSGKKGLRYAEKVALGFYDDGYTRAVEVVARIQVIERSKEIMSKIRQMYGIGDRALSKTEKSLFEKWTQKYEYDIDVIGLAYDITVDRTQKSAPKYTDAILSEWYAAGLRTPEDIERYEREKSGGSNAESGKSYDLDEFFAAALKRSFDDMD